MNREPSFRFGSIFARRQGLSTYSNLCIPNSGFPIHENQREQNDYKQQPSGATQQQEKTIKDQEGKVRAWRRKNATLAPKAKTRSVPAWGPVLVPRLSPIRLLVMNTNIYYVHTHIHICTYICMRNVQCM